MPTSGLFDNESTDFDSLSDLTYTNFCTFEGGTTTDFSAEVDGDSDLNASTDAARDGSYGIELTYDDNNAAYGSITLDSGGVFIIDFDFDMNDVDVGASGGIVLCEVYDFLGSGFVKVEYESDGDIDLLVDEGGGYAVVGSWTVTSGWHHAQLSYQLLTAVQLHIDGELAAAKTVTNMSFEGSARFGIVSADGGTPSGSFYMDNIGADSSTTQGTVARIGYGTHAVLVGDIMGGAECYGRFNPNDSDRSMSVEFDFHNRWWYGNTDENFNMVALVQTTGGVLGQVDVRYGSSINYPVRATWTRDLATDSLVHSDWFDNTGGGTIKYGLRLATDSDSSDGVCFLYINDTLVYSASTCNNGNWTGIGMADFGLLTSFGTTWGTGCGVIWVDNCKWTDSLVWEQPDLAGTLTLTGAITQISKKYFEALAGLLQFVGDFANAYFTTASLSGLLQFTGSITRAHWLSRLLGGTLTMGDGLTYLNGVFKRAHGGLLTLVGATSMKVFYDKMLAGLVQFAGTVWRTTTWKRLVEGVVSASGAVEVRFLRFWKAVIRLVIAPVANKIGLDISPKGFTDIGEDN